VKRDGEVGDVIRGFGKVSLDVFNFLLKLNGKYDLTSKASVAAKSAVDKLKESDSDGTLGKLETSLAAATAKLSSLDMEFGLVEKGKQVNPLARNTESWTRAPRCSATPATSASRPLTSPSS